MNNRKGFVICIAYCIICSLLAYLSSEMQSTVDAIYTATYFSFFLMGLALYCSLQDVKKMNKRREAGLKRWTKEEIDELEERIRTLEEKDP